jgi:hypothetical protein
VARIDMILERFSSATSRWSSSALAVSPPAVAVLIWVLRSKICLISVLAPPIELATCWSIWVRSEVMVLETVEKELARLVSAFITPVRPAEEVGACEAVAKAAERLERPVASDWLSPGPPSKTVQLREQVGHGVIVRSRAAR